MFPSHNKANQLVSSEEDGILTTRYRYDAAGRLIEEGGKSYRYGWLDKVVSVSEEGQVTSTFGYHAGGQLAAATHGGKTESFLWDGLALIRRDGTDYVNEPHAGGGAPVLAGDKVLFNDMLGSTLGAKDANGFDVVQRTAFGETGGNATDEFFTGKPMVGELGYAFLFRNYRPEHGKWQTADLLGYPDGWNNLAYCNNRLADCLDWMGTVIINCHDSNNNNVLVTSGNAMNLGEGAPGTGGAFDPYAVSGSYSSTGEVVVNIYIEMWIQYPLPFDYSVYWCDYLPHDGTQYTGAFAGGFFEVFYAHELAHAAYFFDTIIPQLNNYLQFLNVDSGRFGDSINSVVIDAYNAIAGSTSNVIGSGNRANQATFDYFDTHPYWHQISDSNGWKRWRKGE